MRQGGRMMSQGNKKNRRAYRAQKYAPYIFISPFFIAFLVFSAFPIIYSLFLSFHSWNGIGAMQFNGLDNFVYIFTDSVFWKCLLNTVVMLFMGAVPGILLALLFAFLLNQAFIKMKNMFKGVLFLPYMTSAVAVALIFFIFYGTEFGLLTYLIQQGVDLLNSIGKVLGFHITRPDKIAWLEGTTSLFSVSLLSIWRWTGWNTILILAGMQGIDSALYEAAEIDGASRWQQFCKITIPLLKPILYFIIIISLIGGMQAFDDPKILIPDAAGNAYNGITLSIYIYENAFTHGYYGVGAAASYALFAVILVLTWIFRKIFKGFRKNRR